MRRKRLAVIGILVFCLLLSVHVQAQGPTHVVAPGENLFRIALQYGTTVEALAAANNIADPTHIYVGQVLVIPGPAQQPAQPNPPDNSTANNAVPPATNATAPVYYTVQPGDSLGNIAQRFGVSLQDIITANGLTDPNHIIPGQQLTIPGVSAPGGTAATVPTVPTAQPVVPTPLPPTAIPPTAQPAAPAGNGTTYVVKPGEGLAAIGRQFNIPWPQIAAANNITDPNRIYAGMVLQIPTASSTPPTTMETSMGVPPGPNPPQDSGKFIKVILHEQRVYAFENGTLVRNVLVSTGLPDTPTVTGDYKIYVKYTSQLMTGPGYYLPGVPWVMYFYQGYSFHGTYWHHNWGHPMSHGCVNMPTDEALWLYQWAEVGTSVHIEW